MSEVEPGSRRSPGGAVLQLISEAEPGSRRSPGGAVLQLMSEAEPSSRRRPGGAVLLSIPPRVSAVGILYLTVSFSHEQDLRTT